MHNISYDPIKKQPFILVEGRKFYLQADCEDAPAAMTNGITIKELTEKYLDYAREYYKGSQHIKNMERAMALLNEVYGTMPAAHFTPKRLKELQQILVSYDLTRNYINANVNRVKQAFQWGTSEELIPPSIYHGLLSVGKIKRGRSAARESIPVGPVEDWVVDATMKRLSKTYCNIIMLQRLSGARPGEILQLRPMDLKMNGDICEYRPASHKTQNHGKERVIYFGKRAQEIINYYTKCPADAYFFSSAKPGASRRSLRESYAKAVRRATMYVNADRKKRKLKPLPYWHPHQLRHSVGTEVRKLYSIEHAQMVLGHSRPDTTLIYAENDAAKAIEVMRAIG